MKRNFNIDAVRLAAAAQVLAYHFLEHVMDQTPTIRMLERILAIFPGVPIFFFLSGYLVVRSAERRRSLGDYALKRALRLYPGMWVCLCVSVGLVAMSGYRMHASPREFITWVAAQATILQSYNPQFLRGFGTGVINGSLWTIGVELQFYAIAPLLAPAIRWLGVSRNRLLVVLGALLLGNELFGALKTGGHGDDLTVKSLSITVLPFLYYFVLGAVVFVMRLDRVAYTWRAIAVGAAIHVAASVIIMAAGGRSGGDYVHAFLGATLIGVTALICFGPSLPGGDLLRGRDYSYSLYLYHMPVINLVMYLRMGGVAAVTTVLFATALLAGLSWHLVEKPALRLAHKSDSSPSRGRESAPGAAVDATRIDW